MATNIRIGTKMPKRDFSKMTDAELRANAALIKNKKALDAAATAKQNQE